MLDPTEWKADTTPTNVFNPLSIDVSFEYRDDNNVVENITIHPQETIVYPKHKADIVCTHIVDKMVNGLISPEKRQELIAQVLI